MEDRPILEPVRFGNGSYCVLKDKTLKIEIQNSGLDCDKETKTQIKFPGYGIDSQPTKPLRSGESVMLTFAWPADDFFNVDRVFYVTVDVDNVLGEDPTMRRNVTRVKCKAIVPCLVIIADKNGALAVLESGQLKFTVQNQGTVYARPSKARVDTDIGGEMVVSIEGLEPGYTTTASAKVDQKHYASVTASQKAPLKYKISLDIDDVVHVRNDKSKLPPRVYEGSVSY